MYWVYSVWSLLVLSFCATKVSGTFIVVPLVLKNSKKCEGPDNCGSGNSYCDTAFYKLVDDKYRSERCASNYLQNIAKCNNFTCFVRFVPTTSCRCATDIHTVYNCTDIGSGSCTLKFRSWKIACDSVK